MSEEEIMYLLLCLKKDAVPSRASQVLKTMRPFQRNSSQGGTTHNFRIDEVAESLYPCDADQNLVPVAVYGDGNCLFRSASLLLDGDQRRHLELRLRTAAELCINSCHYANILVQRASCCLDSLSPESLLLSTLKNDSSVVFSEAFLYVVL